MTTSSAFPASASGVQRAIDDLPLNRRHALVFGLCGAGLFFESLNLQLMSFVVPQLVAEWGLTSTQLGMAISSAILGMLVGTYAFGAIADRRGRRFAFQATVGLFSILTALSGFVTSFVQLIAARFVAGIGIGGSIPVETAVLAEFTPGRVRGRAMALWAVALPLGGIAAPLIVGLLPEEWGWRALLFLGGVPALLVLFVRRTIPETPQYLASRGRMTEAEEAIDWIACRPSDREGQSHAAAERVPHAELPVSDLPPEAPERALFAPEYRRATFVSWTLNFGTFFAYYGFVLWLPSLLAGPYGFEKVAILKFMFFAASAGMAGRIAILALADHITRERIMLACTIAGAAALMLFALQEGNGERLVAACVAAFFLEGVFSAAIPFVADVYPARIRATGVGWAGGMGRIATAIAPLAVGALVVTSPRLAIGCLATGSLLAAFAMIYWLLVGRRPASAVPSPGRAPSI